MPASAAIYGCQGIALTEEESSFFREVKPFGFILFARNCADPEQVRSLCASLRETIEDASAFILIDQEGGRVARLKPPHWRARPAVRRFGMMYEADPAAAREAAYLDARLIAEELCALSINVDCAPVLDVPVEGAHDIIGDRAFSEDTSIVIELARAAIDGFLEGGVLPVIKHMPGHGRAEVDSHEALPRVRAKPEELSAHDFVPFRSLNSAPLAMTAHVVYESLDDRRPATTSPKIIREIIRGEIGFDGFLMSDDISMKALSGSVGERAKAALFAGCDAVLHCNGRMEEMKEVSQSAPPLSEKSIRRAEAARARLKDKRNLDIASAEARLEEMLGAAA
jgi:beta-N-acetylhexosaminidase